MQPEYYSPEGMQDELEELLRCFREEIPDTAMAQIPLYLYNIDYDKKSMTVVITPTPWMADRTGYMSNGAFSMALDQTMGILCLYLCDGMTPTVTMQLSLLRPIPLDRRLFIRAHLVNSDGKKLDVSATAWCDGTEAEPVATSVGLYYRGGMRQPIQGYRGNR